MHNQTAAAPEFDPYRIELVREKLADEAYAVDSLQIANKVIDLELALSGTS